VYSHAQRDWTEIKVNWIRKEYEKMYSKDLSLPFFTTDITQTKDSNGWKKVADIFNLDIKNTLVVGDSLKSDILAAIQAGYVNLVHLSTKEEHIDIPKDINLKVVDGIGDILNL
jgi:FMN phosphatase YigB (HAD superfamily)